MTEKAWKRDEKKIARLFGTERTPLSGGNGKQTRSDTLHPDLFIEIKRRKSFPFRTVFGKLQEPARRERKIPVMVLHQSGSRTASSMVILQLSDLPRLSEILQSNKMYPAFSNQATTISTSRADKKDTQGRD